ncbi:MULTISPECIES: hypothetical protein [unclassified Shewanella]|uniref:hypothetical protein n=1 Tax=unclassified Shewanella TaxID=196818 RepID=UPI0021D9C7C6|nr:MULTISPECIES: hypothetical protein [unclassified Shewanella]MCU8036099.1 hypothetical protein [Shewanella sp. SM71]MCU8098055.1 hypothetical protein [Shewanella sp. SM102]
MAYLISNTAKTLIAQAAQFITAMTVADDYVVTRFSVDYQAKNWRISDFANNLFDEQALAVNSLQAAVMLEGYDKKMEIVPAIGSVKKWQVIQSKQNHFLRFIQRKRKRLAYFYASRCFIWQGWQDSNPQPSVLEMVI